MNSVDWMRSRTGFVVTDCKEISNKNVLIRLDSNAIALERTIVGLVKNIRARARSLRPSQRRFLRDALVQARQLRVDAWSAIWTFPQVSFQCNSLPPCAAVSTLGTKAAFQGSANQLTTLANRTISLAKALKVITTKGQQSLLNRVRRWQQSDSQGIASIPNQLVSCG